MYGEMLCVHPQVIDDVLLNPGIGFNTFQRFNGDKLNEGFKWTEGYPIEYQDFNGDLTNIDHPQSTTAYFRVYWRFLEPERGQYNWEMIDKAMATAKQRGQSLLLRVAPHGYDVKENPDIDVPDWFRAMVGEEVYPDDRWAVDGDNPLYIECFGGFIRALGLRYDGHPDLESVDVAIIGPWGEGGGTYKLKPESMKALINAYTDTFKTTPLLGMLTDPVSNKYLLSKAAVAGYRCDCLGDMNMESAWGGAHMLNKYPQQIIICGFHDVWKKGPVSMEVCWVMKHWHRCGWDIDYIIDQSLKWHISSFNSKSSSVPEEWKPNVERWLKKMGYRFVLRHFACPPKLRPGRRMSFHAWWENRGVAPCYRDYPLAFRLKGQGSAAGKEYIIKSNTDIREWLPGDAFQDSEVYIPADVVLGEYTLQIAMLSKHSDEPVIRFAIAGREEDGWYTMGNVTVQNNEDPITFPPELYYE
jgi:hypothetical protein